jgi:TrkA domain protein
MPASRPTTTPLPGIGVRYEPTTRRHDRLSVIAHRDGKRILNVHHDADPDAAGLSLVLTGAEALSLADALLPGRTDPNPLHTGGFGLLAEQVTVTGTSYWNGRTLGETRMRSRTGASIVAVLRRSHAEPIAQRIILWRGKEYPAAGPGRRPVAPRPVEPEPTAAASE